MGIPFPDTVIFLLLKWKRKRIKQEGHVKVTTNIIHSDALPTAEMVWLLYGFSPQAVQGA